MCLSTDQLKFLDMTNYIAPGFSYDKYLKVYVYEVTKGHFPYEYTDRLERLDDTALPSKEAFFSRLKNEGISEEDYASCQKAWRVNDMTTLRQFLVWYNNRDVVPFLQAIDRQFAFYQQRGIDMFKQGISVPGLTLLYLFNDLPEKTYFTIFNEKNKDLHHLVEDHVVGGASLIFHRYHEKGFTTLRQHEYREDARRAGRSSDTMRTRCACGHSCKTCLWDGTRDDGKITTSDPNQRSCTDRWLGMVHLGITTLGHTTPDQQSREENRQTVGGGWCSETNTSYQYHGCFFHGHPCTRLEVNAVNGKPMAELLAETRKNTAYLRHFVKVVELCEYEWKEMRRDREKVSGYCISTTASCTMDDDVTTDPEWRACRNRVRYDRV